MSLPYRHLFYDGMHIAYLAMMSPLSTHKILFKQLFPFTFVVIIWIIHLLQAILDDHWGVYSVIPRTSGGLRGIFLSPLLHNDWAHLLGNTVPLLVLGFLLFYSYREIAGKVFWLVYFLNGTLLWLFARQAIHLGASGVVYGLASFIIISGFIRKNPQLAVLSLLIIFLYGSLVWGIFPFDPHVSWEAHLYGALTGGMLAFLFRKEGPKPRKYFEDEMDEEEKSAQHSNEIPLTGEKEEVKIRYIYKSDDAAGKPQE